MKSIIRSVFTAILILGFSLTVNAQSREVEDALREAEKSIEAAMEQLEKAMEEHSNLIRIESENMEASLSKALAMVEETLKDKDGYLSELKVELAALEERLGKMKTKLKEEMVRDGLIDNVDDKARIEIKGDDVKVNGKKLNKEQSEKYKKIMEEFDLKIDGTNISFDED